MFSDFNRKWYEQFENEIKFIIIIFDEAGFAMKDFLNRNEMKPI